jgi:uncharacterized lipoprotein YddW (UPF0748 family)
MVNKRQFIKSAIVSGLAATVFSPMVSPGGNSTFNNRKRKWRHWVWINPNQKDKVADLQILYAAYYDAGIRGIFFEADSEMHFRAAKDNKMEAHRWIWTMNRGEKSLLEAHPEWYAVNKQGDSCAAKPPYVNYYRWLCPSREEVYQYLEGEVKSLLSKDYVDGIHLDYVRYCDVILPVNLWDNYGISQNAELPSYDYCYCKVCRDAYMQQKGIDPLLIEHPDQSPSWRKFRYDSITKIVNRLSAVVHEYKKTISAAVFPTPEIAKRIVRQDWTNWELDAICPMIYHGFYKEDVNWIGDAVAEGVKGIDGKFPLYAGLYLPDFKHRDEIQKAVDLARQNGAAGVSIFGKPDASVLEILKSSKGNS